MATTIDSLRKKRDQINARIQKMEAAQKDKARKEDTRRKILVGAYTLQQAEKDGNLASLYEVMLIFLSRPADKKLFQKMSDSTDNPIQN